MNSNEILKIAVFAGEIMLSNGAETYRVEDTMQRILQTYDLSLSETFVITTGIFAALEDEKDGVITIVKRIRNRTYDLGKVALVNNFSRQFVKGTMTFEEAKAELDKINKQLPYSPAVRIVSAGVSCFCFTYMFGGIIQSIVISFFVGLILYFLILMLYKKQVSSVLINIIGSCVISFLALCSINIFPSLTAYFDKIIIGSIMPLVPGIGLTNAIRDVLGGDFLSGTSRIVDAILIAVSIAIGVGTVIKVWIYLWGGLVI